MVSLAAEFPNDNPALHRGAIWVVKHPLATPTAERPTERERAPIARDAEGREERAPVLAEVVGEEPPVLTEVVGEEEPASLLEELVVEVAAARPSGIIAIPRDVCLDTFEIEDEDEDVLVEEIEPLVEAVLEGATTREGGRGAEAANDVVPTTTTALPPPPDDPFTVLLTTLADVAVAAGSPHVASLLPALLLEGSVAEVPVEARAALVEASIVDGERVSAAFARTLEAWKAILRGTSDDFDATGGVLLDEWAAGLLARLLGAPARSETLRRDLRSRGVAAFGLAA